MLDIGRCKEQRGVGGAIGHTEAFAAESKLVYAPGKPAFILVVFNSIPFLSNFYKHALAVFPSR